MAISCLHPIEGLAEAEVPSAWSFEIISIFRLGRRISLTVGGLLTVYRERGTLRLRRTSRANSTERHATIRIS